MRVSQRTVKVISVNWERDTMHGALRGILGTMLVHLCGIRKYRYVKHYKYY